MKRLPFCPHHPLPFTEQAWAEQVLRDKGFL
jgi:hypothetical protein